MNEVAAIRRATRALTVVSMAIAGTACASEPSATGPSELHLGVPIIVIAEESALLAVPAGVEVDADGLVYILDRQDQRVIVVNGDGELVRTIGREGEGPGEFSRPRFFGLTDRDIRVFDFRRLTVQVFGRDGSYSTVYSTGPAGVATTGVSFGSDGAMAYSGLEVPRNGGLVARIGPAGGERTLFGDLIAEDTAGSNFITEEIHKGKVPEFMRNNTLPMFAPDGDLWVFLQTEAMLRRYAPDGKLVLSVELHVPEMEAIRAEYFDWYAEFDQGVLRYFSYVVDGFAGDDRVWLLWSTPAGKNGLITIHDETGAMLWRLSCALPLAAAASSDPSTPYVSRRYLAVDPARRVAYLADTDTSSLRALGIPAEVFQ